MTKPDPFGFDMSVSSAKKKATRTRRGMSGASDTSTRECEHEGCSELGNFVHQGRLMCSTNISGSVRIMCANII